MQQYILFNLGCKPACNSISHSKWDANLHAASCYLPTCMLHLLTTRIRTHACMYLVHRCAPKPHIVKCRFNDFLCHTSGMGTVDHEKVLVGNLPSKSLYEYCFHPDQQCWKVSICLLHSRCKLADAGPPAVASSARNWHPVIAAVTESVEA